MPKPFAAVAVAVLAAACSSTPTVAHVPAPPRVDVPAAPPPPVRAEVPTAPTTPRGPVAGTPVVTWQPLHFVEPPPPEPSPAAAEPVLTSSADAAQESAPVRRRRSFGGWYGPYGPGFGYGYYGWHSPWVVPAAVGVGIGIRATHDLHRGMWRALRNGPLRVARNLGRLLR